MLNERALSPKTKTFLLYFLPCYFVFLLFPGSFFGLPATGIDNSWAVALHLALKYHLRFGPDFAFTYGPLAPLRIRYPVVLSKYVYVLSDLYFLFIVYTGLLVFIRQRFRAGLLIFLFFCVLIGQSWDIEKWYQFLILVFLFEFCRRPQKLIYLVHVTLLSILCFYIKINTGLINISMVLLVIHYALVVKKIKWKTYILFVAAFVAALFLSAWLLNTDLLAYVKTCFYLTKDYEESMYYPLLGPLTVRAPWCAVALWSVLAILYIFVLIKTWKGRRFSAGLDVALVYLLVGFVLFTWYKNSFVRADFVHIGQFFSTAAPFAVLLYAHTPPALGRKTVIGLCWLLLGVNLVSLLLLPGSSFAITLSETARFGYIPAKMRDITTYVRGFGTYDKQKFILDSLTSRPNVYRDAVGDHTADIVPIEIATLYFNGIRYKPRPVIQTYSAYDKFLDQLNADKYLSAKGPDFVFFSLVATGERFAWTDECRTKLALLTGYRPEKMVSDQLLLQKEAVPRAMVKLKEDTVQTRMGVWTPVKKGQGILFTRIQVKKNLTGRLRTLVYQPTELRMLYKLANGDGGYFRLLLPIMEEGIILNKFVNTTPEARLFFLSDGRLNEDIRSICIEPVGLNGFQPEITLFNTWYGFGEKPVARRLADSIQLSELLGGGLPLKPLPLTPPRCTTPISYGVDYVRDWAGLIRLAGWAIQPDKDNRNNVVKVLIRSVNDSIYELPWSVYTVTTMPYELFERKDVAGCGFSGMFSRTQLPPGNYQFGVCLYDTAAHTSCYQYLDKYFVIPAPLRLQQLPLADIRKIQPDTLRYNIDEIRTENDTFTISGWAVLPGFHHRTTINLLLVNDTAAYRIEATLIHRADLASAFHDSANFEYSGFSVMLPTMSGPKGKFKLGVEKTGPGGKSLCQVITDNVIEMGQPFFVAPVAIGALPAAGVIYGSLDLLRDRSDTVTIGGWAVGDTLHRFKGRMELILKGLKNSYVVSMNSTSRPDIAGHYHNDALTACGFSVNIDKAALVPGIYEVGICLRPDGAPAYVKFFNRSVEVR